MNSKLLFIILILSFSGVNAQDYWEQIFVQGQPSFWAMVVDHDGYIYVGSKNAKIYRSSDNGDTWELFYIVPNTTLTIYALGLNTKGELLAGLSHRIYKSTDHGESWTKSQGFGSMNILCFAAGFDSLVFAGAYVYNAILRSTDYGDNFEVVCSLPYETMVYDMAIDNNGVVYAGANNTEDITGIYRSFNKGETWEYWGLDRLIYVLDFDQEGNLLAGTNGNGLYKYNGNDWDNIVTNRSVGGIARYKNRIFLACNTMSFEEGGVLYSQNNGESFTEINTGLLSENIRDVVIDSSYYIFAFNEPDNPYYLHRSADPLTSFEETPFENSNSPLIYPNPCSEYFYIGTNHKGIVTIRLYSVAGDCLFVRYYAENETVKVNTKNIPPGICLFEIIERKNIKSGKLVIVK